MYAVIYNGHADGITYATEAQAWRAVHELLEEGFGANYGEAELAKYAVQAV